MKIAAIIALVLVLLVMGMEILRFMKEGNLLAREEAEVGERLSSAKREESSLEANLNYFARPENLEKEMRARFNYRGEGEKLLILVPKESSTTPVQ